MAGKRRKISDPSPPRFPAGLGHFGPEPARSDQSAAALAPWLPAFAGMTTQVDNAPISPASEAPTILIVPLIAGDVANLALSFAPARAPRRSPSRARFSAVAPSLPLSELARLGAGPT